MNPQYFRSVVEAGGEQRLALWYLPLVLRRTLRQLVSLVNSMASTLAFLGQPDDQIVERWLLLLNYSSSSVVNLSFGAWVAANNTKYKQIVLDSRSSTGLNWTTQEMAGLYGLLTDCDDLLSTDACVTSDVATSRPNWAVWTLVNATTLGNTTTDVIAAALCPNAAASCLRIQNDTLALAYVHLIADYVTQQLAPFSFSHAVIETGNDLVVSRPQSDLALGYATGFLATWVPGVLENYDDEKSALNASCLIAVYNCYDAIFAVTNGQWKC